MVARIFVTVVVAGLTSGIGARPACGNIITWDLANDFSATNNPTGAWSYGWKPSSAGGFTLYVSSYISSRPEHPGWRREGQSLPPELWKNTGSTSAYGIAPGQVSIHPGPDYEPSVARWTSPLDGDVDLSGFFGAGDSGSMDVHIQKNGSTIWIQRIGATDLGFDIPDLTVSSGDTLDFLVTGGYWWGSTPVQAVITHTTPETPETPEPATWALVALGVACGVRRRRQARQRAVARDGQHGCRRCEDQGE